MPIVSILVAYATIGQAGVPADALSIPLPPGATTSFEVDARDDDLLGTVKQFIATMGDKFIGSMPNHNPMSSILNTTNLGAILKNVRRIHLVAMKDAPADFTAFYEPGLLRQGAHRMLYLNDQNPILLMRTEAPTGLAAIVRTNTDGYVLRTEGMPDMVMLGRIAGTFVGGMGQMGNPTSDVAAVAPPKTPARAVKTPTPTKPAKPTQSGPKKKK